MDIRISKTQMTGLRLLLSQRNFSPFFAQTLKQFLKQSKLKIKRVGAILWNRDKKFPENKPSIDVNSRPEINY